MEQLPKTQLQHGETEAGDSLKRKRGDGSDRDSGDNAESAAEIDSPLKRAALESTADGARSAVAAKSGDGIHLATAKSSASKSKSLLSISKSKSEPLLANATTPEIKVEDVSDSATDHSDAVTSSRADPSFASSSDIVGSSEKAARPISPMDVEEAPTQKVAVKMEKEGLIEFRVVRNDNTRLNLVLLTGLKNIFQKQLPKMPREYISRLVYDKSHISMAIVRKDMRVMGGISFKPFEERTFAEIVFLAVDSDEQVQGYGSQLMNHLKDFVRKELPSIRHFLTYADLNAVGYFRKQGFTDEITLDPALWVGYIKDYESTCLMQCTMIPKITYLVWKDIIKEHRRAIEEKLRKVTNMYVVRKGLTLFKDGMTSIPVESIPGVLEAGWTPEMSKRCKAIEVDQSEALYTMLRTLLNEIQSNTSAWPFRVPVDGNEVPDYYDIIKDPMDLQTMDNKLEKNEYKSIDEFTVDMNKIFTNCKAYNSEESVYFKTAVRLEKFFRSKLKALTDKKT